jgi:light-regulated signal transduction histidine kinase (bacteriophytochrome)
MQVLINDLLTFSRVGRASDVPVAVPLDQPLDAAATALSAAIEETGTVIERPRPMPEVMGDPTLLGMLWQNLIGNAIKFRAPGRAPVIRITADEQPDGGWQIGVADNGIGVPPEFAEKIFIIFQRLHGRDAYPGTGIGLALCKRIVEQHGGEMFLDTSYSGGTRIYFTVPAPATTPRRLPVQPEIIGAFTLPGPASPSPGDGSGGGLGGGPGAGGLSEPGDENTGTIPEGTPHVRPGTDRSPAGRG